jgi:hypothetical protein
MSNMSGVVSGAVTDYPSRAPEFTFDFLVGSMFFLSCV